MGLSRSDIGGDSTEAQHIRFYTAYVAEVALLIIPAMVLCMRVCCGGRSEKSVRETESATMMVRTYTIIDRTRCLKVHG